MEEMIFLEPAFTTNVWGGTRLREVFHYPVSCDTIGECWGISAHPKGDCRIRSGTYQGELLSQLWKKHPEIFGPDSNKKPFPLLVKIIDAKDDLSIQVHPDDSYAAIHEEGAYGKTECWYILDCTEDAELIIGHNAKDKAALVEMIENQQWNRLLHTVKIKKGDLIPILPGTLHAIKGGILLLEIQQSSDITYRIYDYDRLWNGKTRPLHLAQSLDVITVPASPIENYMSNFEAIPCNCLKSMFQCEHFEVSKVKLDGSFSFDKAADYYLCTVASGEGMIQEHEVKKGDHFIISYAAKRINMKGKMELILANV